MSQNLNGKETVSIGATAESNLANLATAAFQNGTIKNAASDAANAFKFLAGKPYVVRVYPATGDLGTATAAYVNVAGTAAALTEGACESFMIVSTDLWVPLGPYAVDKTVSIKAVSGTPAVQAFGLDAAATTALPV